MDDQVTPDAILQLGLGFWGSKALLSAVELGLFTQLANRPLTAKSLQAELGLQLRGTADFLDALVSLGMLERDGDEYRNTAATDLFLDREELSRQTGQALHHPPPTVLREELVYLYAARRDKISTPPAPGAVRGVGARPPSCSFALHSVTDVDISHRAASAAHRGLHRAHIGAASCPHRGLIGAIAAASQR